MSKVVRNLNRIRLNTIGFFYNVNGIGFDEKGSDTPVIVTGTRFVGNKIVVEESGSSFLANVAVFGGTSRFENNKVLFNKK